ncbi:MAG: Cu(I)-responsive transcriptional regulator [Alphaproteobacteria bacterium]|nr:Cu(I)-responsive transcriptional regulator [Alphaproteobacteria bacterium]
MNIGTAAELSNLPAKTIRYYEEIALVRPDRADNGYRDYTDNDVKRLRFLQRSRSLGFTIQECRRLISLYDDASRASADVRAIAMLKIGQIETKIAELRSLKAELGTLVEGCNGDERPECTIIDALSGRGGRQ